MHKTDMVHKHDHGEEPKHEDFLGAETRHRHQAQAPGTETRHRHQAQTQVQKPGTNNTDTRHRIVVRSSRMANLTVYGCNPLDRYALHKD